VALTGEGVAPLPVCGVSERTRQPGEQPNPQLIVSTPQHHQRILEEGHHLEIGTGALPHEDPPVAEGGTGQSAGVSCALSDLGSAQGRLLGARVLGGTGLGVAEIEEDLQSQALV